MEFKTWFEDIQKYLPFMLPKPISPEDVEKLHLFGPVYHGTTEDNRKLIQHQGFQFFKGLPRAANVSHGYEMHGYGYSDTPPPIHHLGFGAYFTRAYSIAKDFNLGTSRGLEDYYVGGANYKRPRILEINWGSPNTMMKWWRENGYDMPSIKSIKDPQELEDQWIKSTDNLTNYLKSKYDAVYYKGKGMRKLLDGDQVCVYRPEECIYTINYKMSPGYNTENGTTIRPGDRIQIKGTKATGLVAKISPSRKDDPWNWAFPSKYEIMVGSLKGMEEIVRVHAPALLNAIQKADKSNKSIMVTRRSNMTKEESVQRWYEYNIMKSVFEHKVPSALVAGILQPKEKTKSDWAKLTEALDREKRQRLRKRTMQPNIRQTVIYT
jgi:hypothetical protein